MATEEEQAAETTKYRAMAMIPGTSPFEVFLLFACFAISTTRLMGVAPPPSIATSLPTWAVYLWYISLGLGSAVGLYGGLKPRKVLPGQYENKLRDGLVQYAIGWSYVGTASLTYGIAVLLVHPPAGIVAGGMTTAWGVASLLRANQVRKLLHMRGGGKHAHVG